MHVIPLQSCSTVHVWSVTWVNMQINIIFYSFESLLSYVKLHHTVVLTCTHYLFQGPAGSETITVTVGNMSETADSSFTYDDDLTSQISGLSPQTTTVAGESRTPRAVTSDRASVLCSLMLK